MTVPRDMSRPTSQHRSSISSIPSSLPTRNSYSRSHSNSLSLNSYNPTHRVTRRKSTTLNNNAALSAAIQAAAEGDDEGARIAHRRSIPSKSSIGPSSLPHHISAPDALQYAKNRTNNGSAVVDGPSLSKDSMKPRMRRSSEGGALLKKKSGTGDLKCDTCGKGYKHSSCLTKHLWEHTPEWSLTSKLLISKHQQVQLLEAASVLVTMNNDAMAAAEAAKSSDSDNSSASPAASGSSGLPDDDVSSAETTPPPQTERVFGHRKQYSNASSAAFSRSYQSVFSASESVPKYQDPFQHGRKWSTSSSRPVTAGTSIAESYPNEDQADLAAAVGLLSCSYGTPKSGPVVLPPDVPPVPPLPARYQGLSSTFSGTSYSQSPGLSKAMPRYQEEDVDMDEESSEDDDNDRRYQSHEHSRADDMDDGVFGQMEE